MSKPLSEDSISYIIFGYDPDGIIHPYHLRMNGGSKERARIKFELLAEANGWEPFTQIDVFRLSSDEELESLPLLGPVASREANVK